MKIPKTLFFMVLNPIPLIVHSTWWFLFAALSVVFDDPFVEGRWPYIAQIVSPPSSFGNYVTAASIIIDEIVDDIWRNGFWIYVATPLFFICYREARGNLKGIAKEQQVWMRWYRRQQEAIAQGSTLEESPSSSEDKKINTYFRKALKTLLSLARNPVFLIVHFAYWFSAFTLLYAFFAFTLPYIVTDWTGLVDRAREFVKMLPPFAIASLVLALLSSYQETRGTVKGIIKVRQMWAEWYYRRQEAKAQGVPFEMSPPLLHIY